MKRLVFIACGALLIIGTIWAYVWWHSPAETKHFTASTETRDVLGSESTLATWNTQYFTTRYPNDLRVITSNEVAHGPILGQYLLGSTVMNRTDQLAVTVGTLEGSTFDELPAVKLRHQRTDVYQPVRLSFVPLNGVAFRAVDGYELSIFWPQGTRYAAVVVSGSSAREAELEQALEAVVMDWQWR
jgi:hypothetical protein